MNINPYKDADFFTFFLTLGKRIGLFFSNPSEFTIASDEIQLLVLLLGSISCAIVGSFLFVKKMTMMANALSHTVLLGIVLFGLITHFAYPYALWQMVLAATLSAFLTVLGTFLGVRLFRMESESSIAFHFIALYGLAIYLISVLMPSSHLGIESIVGNLDAVSLKDLKELALLALFNLVLYMLFASRLITVAFDRSFAAASRIPCNIYDLILLLMASLTSIFLFKSLGVFLFLSILVTPVLFSRLTCNRFNKIVFFSMGFSAIISIISIALSRHAISTWKLSFSTGALCSVLMGIVFVVAIVLDKLKQQKAVEPAE